MYSGMTVIAPKNAIDSSAIWPIESEKFARAEDAQVEQRVVDLLQEQLAPDEQAERDDADRERHDERDRRRGGGRGIRCRRAVRGRAADLAEAEDDARRSRGPRG